MRRHLLLVAALSLLPVGALAADAAPAPAASPQSAADGIVGRWKTSDGDAVVAISGGPSGYVGVIVESPKDPALAGQQMFRGLVYDAKNAAWSGEVYAPKRKEYLPAVITLSGEGFVLKAGSGLRSKKITWSRA